jgi:tRNA-specific 2-thiouridylase
MAEVQAGRTPNPDIFCNTRIKFGFFLESIDGFDRVASGHYAQIVQVGDNLCLKQAPDPVKDQTYFLSQLPPEKLQHLMFPIGSYTKKEVRSLAWEFALPNRNRKDSQGICFLGKFNYNQFLEHYLGTKPGNLVDSASGKTLGQHRGFWFYTKGQRRGIGLSGGPWYVVDKNTDDNTVFISQNYHNSDLATNRRKFSIGSGNWFLGVKPARSVLVKLRHGPEFHTCSVDGNVVTLTEPDQGIAAGQYAAFYQDDLCLGSAVISA